MKKKLLIIPLLFVLIGVLFAQTGRPVRLWDTNTTDFLTLTWNENDTSARVLNFLVSAGNRSLTLSGDLTVESASLINQDLTTDSATGQLAGLALTGNLTLAANSITGTSVDINNAELQQISAIGATTISGTQWGYLGASDQGFATSSSPTYVTVKLSGLTDGYVPYHVADATGLANSVIYTDGTDIDITTGQLWISTDSEPLIFGAAATDYTIQWDGSDAVHTVVAGEFTFTGGGITEVGGVLKENLLTNSGFGVWSQSDTNKGLGAMTYDSGGTTAPAVGDTLTGDTSGATGKIISYTLTGGSWAGGDAAGVIQLGACTGRFQDNETFTTTTGGANTGTVNMPDSAAGVDLVQNGEFESATTGWTPTDCTLASIAGGQVGNCLELTRTGGANQLAYPSTMTLVVGKIYKFVVYVKSGTSGNETFQCDDNEGNLLYSGVTSAAWVKHEQVFEATNVGCTFRLRKMTATAGTMLFDQVSLYEITPCCTAADTVAMDVWQKDSTLDIYRQHNDGGTLTKDGSFYAVKAVPTAASDWLLWNNVIYSLAEFYQRFAGRTVTVGCWAKTSTASHFRLRVQGSGSTTNSAYHTGGGAWEWLEITHTFSASTTYVYATYFDFNAAPNVDGSTIVYVSQPMLVFGSSIGSSNFSSPPGEEIYLEKPITSNTYHNKTSQSDIAVADFNVEAEFSAMIPKGAAAALIQAQANDSGSAGTDCYVRLRSDSTKGYEWYCSPYGLANDTDARFSGWVRLDSSGDFDINLEASGGSTFDLDSFQVVAVKLR